MRQQMLTAKTTVLRAGSSLQRFWGLQSGPQLDDGLVRLPTSIIAIGSRAASARISPWFAAMF
jgi:hypothetical protein